MDANQFDELVARLAEGPSRRDALKGALGGALATIGIGAAAQQDADAKGKGNGKGRGNGKNHGGGKDRKNNGRGNAHGQGGVSDEKKKNKKRCKHGKKHCGNKHKCFNLQTNHEHCGTCSTACAVDEECIAGICTPIT